MVIEWCKVQQALLKLRCLEFWIRTIGFGIQLDPRTWVNIQSKLGLVEIGNEDRPV